VQLIAPEDTPDDNLFLTLICYVCVRALIYFWFS
jgi:hypothetical protein